MIKLFLKKFCDFNLSKQSEYWSFESYQTFEWRPMGYYLFLIKPIDFNWFVKVYKKYGFLKVLINMSDTACDEKLMEYYQVDGEKFALIPESTLLAFVAVFNYIPISKSDSLYVSITKDMIVLNKLAKPAKELPKNLSNLFKMCALLGFLLEDESISNTVYVSHLMNDDEQHDIRSEYSDNSTVMQGFSSHPNIS